MGASRPVSTLEHAANTVSATASVAIRALRTTPSLGRFHGKVRGSDREWVVVSQAGERLQGVVGIDVVGNHEEGHDESNHEHSQRQAE